MSIRYVCETCTDRQPAHSSPSRHQWELPEGWVSLGQARYVDDQDEEPNHHFCGFACAEAYVLERLKEQDGKFSRLES
jgi:hypothetical protein